MILPLLLSLAGAVAPGEQVIAKVDGAEIRRAEVASRMAQLGAPGRPARADAALEGLVNETLMAAEGRRLGLAGSTVAQELAQGEVRRAAGALLAEELVAKAEVTEPQLRALFHSTADVAAYDWLAYASREAATAAAGRIAGGARLEAEAAGAVVAQVAAAPAQAKPVSRAQIDPPLAALLFAAGPGQLVGPVEAPTGWVLARLLAKEIGTEAAFAERRPALVRFGKAQAADQAKHHLAAQRRAKVEVKLDEKFLAATKGFDATLAELAHPVATVGGAPIRYRELLLSMQQVAAGGGHGGASLSMKQQMLTALVDERLLQDQAVEQGLGSRPAVTSRQAEFERLALAQAAALRILETAPPPGEAEISSYYQAHAAAFGRPFEQVLPEVAGRATEQKRSDTLQARMRELRRAATVTIDHAALMAIAPGEAR